MEGTQEEKKQPQFSKINYKTQTHINYIQDFITQHPNINYADYDLQTCDSNYKETVKYNSIHQKIYKKCVRDGYLDKTNNFARKSKRGGDENFYNTADPFIDDGQALQQKDRKEPVYTDFKGISCSLEQFYSSHNFAPQRINEGKRKLNRMQITQQQKESIMKRVKTNRTKEQQEGGKKQ